MNFICSNDYIAQIKTPVLAQVLDDTGKREVAEAFAYQQVKGYLCGLYDTFRVLDAHQIVSFTTNTIFTKGQVVVKLDGTQFYCIQNGNDTLLLDPLYFVSSSFIRRQYNALNTFVPGEVIIDSEGLEYLCIKTAVGIALSSTEHFYLKRNELILMYFIDIAIYHLHASIQQKEVPLTRHTRYEMALEELTKIQTGKSCPALPRPFTDGDGDGANDLVFHRIFTVSNPRRNNKW
jgi:hypothetical protein